MDDKTNKNLQEAGLKATLPRIKILEIMQRTAGTEDHYTADVAMNLLAYRRN